VNGRNQGARQIGLRKESFVTGALRRVQDVGRVATNETARFDRESHPQLRIEEAPDATSVGSHFVSLEQVPNAIIQAAPQSCEAR
jgi:hypothetical protein